MKKQSPGDLHNGGNNRKIFGSILTGFRGKCPACHRGPLYTSYLKVRDTCEYCEEELHHHRADDAPPYFTIFVVGHFIVGGVLLTEKFIAPDTWVHLSVWIPLTILLSLWFLPLVKGALIGLQWALRLHGFGEEKDQ